MKFIVREQKGNFQGIKGICFLLWEALVIQLLKQALVKENSDVVTELITFPTTRPVNKKRKLNNS